jgi:hypothetical protein
LRTSIAPYIREQAKVDGSHGSLRPIRDPKLGNDMSDVHLDGGQAQLELVGNLRVRQPLSQ